jgi:hypothetical protein
MTLTDEQLRALRLLAHHPGGCADAVLLAEGFHVGQLAVLVIDGFAKMYRKATDVAGRRGTWSGWRSPRRGGKSTAGSRP